MCGALSQPRDVYRAHPCQGSGSVDKEGTEIVLKEPETEKDESEPVL